MQCHVFESSAINDFGVKISHKKIMCFEFCFSSSGLKGGGVWKLQLTARPAGVNTVI